MANLLTFVVPLPFSVGGITVPFDVFAEFLPTSARLVLPGYCFSSFIPFTNRRITLFMTGERIS
jgi:hypothetical protein